MNFQRDEYYQVGKNITRRQEDQLSTQLAVFKSALVNFASDHGEEIIHNLEFRTKFTQMCQSVGVDPLNLQIMTSGSSGGAGSANKSNNNNNNNGGGEIALAVRVVEECHKTRDANGGLISFKELLLRLKGEDDTSGSSNSNINVTEQDITQCLTKLNSLGNGYETLNISGKKWLKFTNNVSNDHKRVYELCEFMGGMVTYRLLRDNYQWDQVRCKTVIDEMIMKGFLWVDQGESETQFWEPSWLSV
ncbi:vacuolar-sorting protein Snf8p [[Candida] railenensis]|uniref:Vacuolar-sorting protein Snf8p n=1 Tax=[Candida] railenensis TaxID=45579 RepID=A0A9P0VXI3_9ASCO|nr:vacuolar-sorting protein Snf8p [[Candida] railenensis]